MSLRLKYGDIFRSKPKEKRKDSDVSVENQPKNRRKRTDSESSCRSDTSHVSASSRISSLGDRLLHISGASEGVIGYRTIVQRNIVEKNQFPDERQSTGSQRVVTSLFDVTEQVNFIPFRWTNKIPSLKDSGCVYIGFD